MNTNTISRDISRFADLKELYAEQIAYTEKYV